jgi:hypothetical protein
VAEHVVAVGGDRSLDQVVADVLALAGAPA